jgi:deazaflavin-dependent oxidoreductase (nitroreductase family)
MADLLNGIPRVDLTGVPPWSIRAVTRLLATKPGAALHRTLFAPIDTALLRFTGGRMSTAVGMFRLVVLRSTGARSGKERDVSLTYFTEGDDVVLIASNYGQGKHPSWYHNLLENPECELFAGGRSGRFIARPTEGADHDRLFAIAQRWAQNYASYAVKTDGVRDIPVLRLTPVAG